MNETQALKIIIDYGSTHKLDSLNDCISRLFRDDSLTPEQLKARDIVVDLMTAVQYFDTKPTIH